MTERPGIVVCCTSSLLSHRHTHLLPETSRYLRTASQRKTEPLVRTIISSSIITTTMVLPMVVLVGKVTALATIMPPTYGQATAFPRMMRLCTIRTDRTVSRWTVGSGS